jgi:hypothetical protein
VLDRMRDVVEQRKRQRPSTPSEGPVQMIRILAPSWLVDSLSTIAKNCAGPCWQASLEAIHARLAAWRAALASQLN